MKKLIVGGGTVICGLMLLCTDYMVKSVIAAMPNVYLVDGAAMFSLSAVGWILIGIGIAAAILGCSRG